jgi:2-polyprenyl-3-methyl-5-hydroxy-6-metoxy-1,4-benzoquinol methylase
MDEIIQRNCPVCGETSARPWLEKHGMQIVQCAACGMVYANPIAARYASGEYYDTEASVYYLSEDKVRSDYSRTRFARETAFFRRHCRRGRVLDVGCSSGAFLYQLQTSFPGDYDVTGTDVSGLPLDYAESRGVRVARKDFLSPDFPGGGYDAITFWAVLEHLANPKAFIEKAAGLLNSNGLCFLLVPNLGSLAVRLIGSRYRYIYAQHLNYFNRETLGRIVASQFDVIEMRQMHFNPIVIWQDWKSGGEDVSNAKRGALLSKTTAYKTNPLLAPLKALYKAVEIGLGRFGVADNLVAVLRVKQDD